MYTLSWSEFSLTNLEDKSFTYYSGLVTFQRFHQCTVFAVQAKWIVAPSDPIRIIYIDTFTLHSRHAISLLGSEKTRTNTRRHDTVGVAWTMSICVIKQ